jgi:DNA-binding PadR family transcriptional regulator
MTESGDPIEQLRLELRRGIVVLAVLSQTQPAVYGYNLIQRLSALGLDIEEGTLYPLLRRLEKQGLLQSEWDTTESRPRKYYQISPAGHDVLAALRGEWQATVAVMNRILEGETHE